MKNFLTLKILDRFKFIFLSLGINYPIMRRILQLKLIMDERRVPTILLNEQYKEDANVFRKSLLMYGFMGAVFMMFIFLPFPMFFKMNFIIAIILFMVMSVMVSDYSSVLLDIKEKNILLPKPIDTRTLNAAKIIHILIYLFTIILTIAGPTLLAGTLRYGAIFGLLFFIELIFIAGFIIFSTSMLYFFILYFFNGEKLKDIINYFQIILTVVMVLLYQVVGRVFQIFDLEVVYTPKWWNYLIPSVWFSAPFSIFIENSQEIHFYYFSLLGIIVPILMIIIYLKVVAPYFEGVLQKLNHNSGRGLKNIGEGERRHKRIASLFCYNRMENIFYRFTQNMIASERTLKLKLYPSLVFATLLPIIFIFRSLSLSVSLAESIRSLREEEYFLYLYFTVTMLASSIPLLSTSERNRAAWIYQTLPIEDPNLIHKGALKAFISKYILPIFSFVGLIFMGVYGFRIIPDLFLIFSNMILLIIIIFHYSHKPLPFSQDFQYIKHNNLTTLIQTFSFSGLSAAIHWFFISRGYSVIPYILGVLVVIIFTWKRVFSKKSSIIIDLPENESLLEEE